MVGGAEHFVQHLVEHFGQALAAVVGRAGQRSPAVLPELLVGLFGAGGHGDGAVGKVRPDFVAVAAQGGNFVGHEAGGFFQHLLHQFAIGIGKRGQGLQLGGNLQHVVQDELDVGGVGLVVHVVLIAGYA